MSISICAIIGTRNEAFHLARLLPTLEAQNIQVAMVNHDSRDETSAIIHKYQRIIIEVVELPYVGHFSLPDMLDAKRELLKRISFNWVIHHDTDEILTHREPKKNLREAIEEADAEGYNVLNFDEFVFLPYADGHTHLSERYYHFAPDANRLNRAWKTSDPINGFIKGGHRLDGQLKIYPVNHTLKHYIVSDQQHAIDKYTTRKFDPKATAMGWHRNRLHLTQKMLELPEVGHPNMITYDPSKALDRSTPLKKHYWHWHQNA